MDFKFSEEHLAFRDMAAEFARNKLAPNAANWDEHSFFQLKSCEKRQASVWLALSLLKILGALISNG